MVIAWLRHLIGLLFLSQCTCTGGESIYWQKLVRLRYSWWRHAPFQLPSDPVDLSHYIQKNRLTFYSFSWQSINCVSLSVQKCVFLAQALSMLIDSSHFLSSFLLWIYAVRSPGQSLAWELWSMGRMPRPLSYGPIEAYTCRSKSTPNHIIWVR